MSFYFHQPTTSQMQFSVSKKDSQTLKWKKNTRKNGKNDRWKWEDNGYDGTIIQEEWNVNKVVKLVITHRVE